MKKEIKTDILVIGNSAAAIGAAAAFKKINYPGMVTFVSKEQISSYSRPFIIYYAGGKIEKERLFYHKKDFLASQGFKEMTNITIGNVDTSNKTAVSANATFHYNKLLVASGSTPIYPPITGLNLENVLCFMSFSDAENLRARAKNIKSAVVIGGGLIGLKAIEALHYLGIKVSVVEMTDYLMARVLDEKSAHLMQNEMEKIGTKVYTKTYVSEIYGDKKVKGVKLSNGEKIDTDIVIVSVGVKPALGFLNHDSFIPVSRFMKTDIDDVFAAGDITASFNLISKKNEPNPTWPVAYTEGFTAALNMAGQIVKFAGAFAQNVIEFNNYPVISYGTTKKERDSDEELTNFDKANNFYRKVVIRENHIIGAVLSGKIDGAGIYKGLIEKEMDAAAFRGKLVNFDFNYKDLPTDYFKQMFYTVSS